MRDYIFYKEVRSFVHWSLYIKFDYVSASIYSWICITVYNIILDSPQSRQMNVTVCRWRTLVCPRVEVHSFLTSFVLHQNYSVFFLYLFWMVSEMRGKWPNRRFFVVVVFFLDLLKIARSRSHFAFCSGNKY